MVMFAKISGLKTTTNIINIFNKKMCTKVQDLKSIFQKSVEAVLPPKLIKEHIKLTKNTLHVYDKKYQINNNCYIVGFGKAVYEMSQQLEKILGDHLVRGFVSIPYGMLQNHPQSRIIYMEGALNNLPDEASAKTAKEITNLIKPLTKNDLLFVLISGGGSALLPAPVPSIHLEDKTRIIKLLANRGADIYEINSVRKRLSVLKGGGLAHLAAPATVVSLILSDVVGDPLDFIASGPTVQNVDNPDYAKLIICKYLEDEEVPHRIKNYLNLQQTPVKHVQNVSNFLIGNNMLALRNACRQAQTYHYTTTIMSNTVSANVVTVSKAYTLLAVDVYRILTDQSNNLHELLNYKETLGLSDSSICELLDNLKGKTSQCLIFGGEPTVHVTGQGKGGRNQQLALQFSVNLCNKTQHVKPMKIMLLSAGTDGIDGPTDAAGAIGFNGLCEKAAIDKINPEEYLQNNDSYNFYKLFSNGQYILETGHTGTNVMDVHILLINK